jgi:hypothetical protein
LSQNCHVIHLFGTDRNNFQDGPEWSSKNVNKNPGTIGSKGR